MQLGWIDFSKEDRQKAFDVINLLSEQGAVDELGIGVIRDAFANYFFPGTSTIQTRACLKNKNCTKRMFYFPFS